MQLKNSDVKLDKLIKVIVQDFMPNFVPDGRLLYIGDTDETRALYESGGLQTLGIIDADTYNKMPNIVIHDPTKDSLLLIEAIPCHGPINTQRKTELAKLFEAAQLDLIHITAFLTYADLTRCISDIAWGTYVWIGEAENHLIHFDGEQLVGPNKKLTCSSV
jgi:hypothetical protein